jgi:hypothetical protein
MESQQKAELIETFVPTKRQDKNDANGVRP